MNARLYRKTLGIFLAAALLFTLLPVSAVHAIEYDYVNDGTFHYAIANGEAVLYNVVEGVKLTGKITLPSSVNGVPVTTIERLERQPGITELTIPYSVTTLKENCLSSLTGLKKLFIPASVTRFARNIISDCENLSFVYLDGRRDSIMLRMLPGGAKLFVDCDVEQIFQSYNGSGWFCPLSEIHYDPLTAAEKTEGQFSYVISDGKATVTAAPNEGDVTIPATLGGAPVCYLLPSLFYNGQIGKVTLPETVQELPMRCFYNSTISGINLGSVQRIGYECFAYTVKLRTLPDLSKCKNIGTGAFVGSGLTRIELPEGVESVGRNAFSECRNCRFFSLPSTLVRIGENAFYNTWTSKLTIPESLTVISNGAFYNSIMNLSNITGEPEYDITISLPDTLTEIGDNAFNSCRVYGLKLPDSLQSIGAAAFKNCYFNNELIIPSSVKTIGDEAFKYCRIDKVTLLPGVKHIGTAAFQGNYGELVLPEGIETIGTSALCAFYETDSLTVPAGVQECDGAFSNEFGNVPTLKTVYGYDPAVEAAALEAGLRYIDMNTGKEAPAPYSKTKDGVEYQILSTCAILLDGKNASGSLTIPDTVDGKPVIKIKANAFDGNSKLTDVTIPDSVTNISTGLFRSCQELQTARLGNGIKTIPEFCFQNCRKLQSVELPQNLDTIERFAFNCCAALESVSFPESLRVIGEMAFSDCDSLMFVILPERLERVEYYAFSSCDNLRLLYLYDDFEYQHLYAFPGEEDTLQDITGACILYRAGTKAEEYVKKLNAYAYAIPEDGEYYMTQNAVYRRDGEEMTLVFCPVDQGGLFVMDDTVADLPVTVIGENAFEQRGHLIYETQIFLGDHVRRLEKYAFRNLANMTLIRFPDATVDIDPEAFAGAESLILLGKVGGPIEQIAEEKKYDGFDFFNNTIHPFTDLSLSWYYNPVLWAYTHEPQITNGTSETQFSPANPCTRGQVVSFLWRANGAPAVENAENPFTDIKEGAYYYEAVLWAVQNGITTGTSNTSFSPRQNCTRAQVVTFLWRAMGSPAPELKDVPFVDVKNDYYYNAMLWAIENGITNGTSSTRFSPNNACTRAQVVTFLWRCDALTAED